MADEIENPQDQTGPESGSPESDSEAELFLDELAGSKDEFSEEDVEEFLKKQDPDFVGQLSGIQGDKDLSLTEAEVDLDTAALHDEIERWRTSKGIRRTLYLFFPFLPRVSLALKKLWSRLFVLMRAVRMRLQDFAHYMATSGRRRAQAWTFAQISRVREGTSKFFGELRKLSLKLKLALAGLIALFVAGSALVFLLWKGKLLPAEKELFVTDLAAHASEVFEVEDLEGFENFYDNIRSTPNLLLIQKLVVNVKSSENSGSNPMAAMEIFVEGLNPDVVIEVKDRESFFRDLVQRVTEEFSFDELSSAEGKRQYLQTLLKEMNRHLTTGELRSARFKTIILKP